MAVYSSHFSQFFVRQKISICCRFARPEANVSRRKLSSVIPSQ